MPLNRLKEVLENNQIKYVSILHGKAYTAQELAHTMHVPGKEFIKSVITVDNNGKNYLVALPADFRLNLNKLAKSLDVDKVDLISEQKMGVMFPNTELGAMPPFGTLYNINTIIDQHVTNDTEIVFNAGTHSEAIKMKYIDFFNLEHPMIAEIAEHIH